ncbi:MAG TPA: tRNA pseudouridine(38-40) synthase TruA [Thermoanaerobaculia bacterium]|jgi:tRNA pseudouridine38-40 synthase|nr:tRNA pseudouridine(38-40) synthase TruA [Thermoanaerobaculia bacterium]
MPVYRLTLSYRGTAYAGWQRQENARSVQQTVEEALERLLGGGGRPVRVVGASRTDAGVHARGQAAHLELAAPFPERGLVHGGNHHLPEDVRILAAAAMPPGFHARQHARGKEYLYRLSRAAVLSPLDSLFVARLPGAVDLEAMQRAAAVLPGRHDFSAFALAGGSHGQPFRHIVAARWEEAGEELRFRVVGAGFLRGMVRALVGTLVEVGTGRRSLQSFAGLLAGGPRAAAGPTAPAHGLVLERVLYPPEWSAEGDPAPPVII